MKIGSTRAGANQCPLGVERFGLTLCLLSYRRFVIFGIFFSVYIEACLLCFVCLYMVKSEDEICADLRLSLDDIYVRTPCITYLVLSRSL